LRVFGSRGDKRISLQRVFYLYNAAGGAVLKNVHIYDGPEARLAPGAESDFEGDYSTAITSDVSSANKYRFPDPLPTIHWGLSISLNVMSTRAESRFFVSTAGADFYIER